MKKNPYHAHRIQRAKVILDTLPNGFPSDLVPIINEYADPYYENDIKSYQLQIDLEQLAVVTTFDYGLKSEAMLKKIIDCALTAAKNGYIKTLKCLLDNHPDLLLTNLSPTPTVTHREETTLLNKAIIHGQRGISLMLLEQYVMTAKTLNCWGKRTYPNTVEHDNNALINAIEYGDKEIVQLLLRAGADPLIKNPLDKKSDSALTVAAQQVLKNQDDLDKKTRHAVFVVVYAYTDCRRLTKKEIEFFRGIQQGKATLPVPQQPFLQPLYQYVCGLGIFSCLEKKEPLPNERPYQLFPEIHTLK